MIDLLTYTMALVGIGAIIMAVALAAYILITERLGGPPK